LIAICSSGIIHYVHSYRFPQDFDFETLESKIRLVENDFSGLAEEDKDPKMLDDSYKWIKSRGLAITIVLVVVWPLASMPAGKFSKGYFNLWVLIAIIWGLASTLIITFLPIYESSGELRLIFSSILNKKGFANISKEDTDSDHSGEEENIVVENISFCALKNLDRTQTIVPSV